MPLASHWRVYVEEFNPESVFWGINELEMADVKNGVNLCTGGTPNASSFHPSWTPAQAFNGTKNASEGWLTSNQNGNQTFRVNQWISYQFATPVDIVEVRITSCDTGLTGTIGSHPIIFHIEYSNDGVQWTRIASYEEPTGEWRDREQRTYAVTNVRPELLEYTDTYIQPRESSYQGSVNDGIRSTQTNTQYAGWNLVDGDVIQADFTQTVIEYVRVYFVDGTGNAGVNRPSSLYVKVNGNTIQADLTGDEDVWVSLGHSNWGDIIYVDIPVNEVTDQVVVGFTGVTWQMLVEVDIYESVASYEITGKTTASSRNIPKSMNVFAHNQATGILIGSGVSDPITGDFTISTTLGVPVFIRAVDPDGIYNSVVIENVIPVLVEQV